MGLIIRLIMVGIPATKLIAKYGKKAYVAAKKSYNTKENKRTGDIIHIHVFNFWTIINSFLINFIPSTIGCNKPNQPIL